MATYRVMSVLKPTSGLIVDASVNTFHVETLETDPNWAALRSAWLNLMDDLRGWFTDTVAETGHLLKAYNLASPEPRAPVYDATWDFGDPPAGETLPAEVALCISYQGARASGSNQARRRGRMFLGPIAITRSVDGRPDPALADDIPGRFVTFIEDLNAASFNFVVRSRANDSNVLVTNVWVDNAWDTQRRRGVDVTGRWSVDIDQLA